LEERFRKDGGMVVSGLSNGCCFNVKGEGESESESEEKSKRHKHKQSRKECILRLSRWYILREAQSDGEMIPTIRRGGVMSDIEYEITTMRNEE